MIKTNLIKRAAKPDCQLVKWLVPGLSIVLLIQFAVLYTNYTDAHKQKQQLEAAQQRLDELKLDQAKLQSAENLQELAGKVAARNNWLFDRKNSPLSALAKLQKDCPNNVKFMAFNADLTSGKIVLTAPDLNSVSSWLNSHFSNKGNISVIGKENNLLLIQFVWSG